VTDLPPLHTLWIGSRLGWLERLCLTSWLAMGHPVTLWSYEAPANVPAGAELRAADEMLPASEIVLHRPTGSVALFSNRFRYHLLRRYPVTWLDADVLLLRPLHASAPHVFGWESEELIGTAVLRLPGSSPLLDDLLALTDARVPIPNWWPRHWKIAQRLLGRVGMQCRAEHMRWATFGPRALTRTVEDHEYTNLAAPRDVFYPIHHSEAHRLLAESESVCASLGEATISVHLWNSSDAMRRMRDRLPPAKSWLGKMCARYGIEEPQDSP